MSKIVPTKIGIPRLDSSVVLRPQLMHLYDDGLHRRLTLVSAPAGYGKTTSTILWLRALDEQSASPTGITDRVRRAWSSLDREDNDVSTFFTCLVAAVEAASPGTTLSVATGLAIQSIPTEQYANSLAAAFLSLPEQVVLVLDDYHLITTPEVHEILARLIRYAFPKLHLVITTRHDPPLHLMRLRAENHVTEIRTNHLLMSMGEAADFLRIRLDQRPGHDLVAELHARTEGWVAGLQLAAAAIHGYGGQLSFAGELHRGDGRYVLDYLFDEVLDHEPPSVREFLLKTALLERFNTELAAYITHFELPTCQSILDDLRRQNLFVVALDEQNAWVRYHRQFQAMLVNRAQVALSAADIRTLRSDAAAWLIAHDRLDGAFDEYVTAKEWEKAAELVALDCHRLQNREHWHVLWRRMAQLPHEIVESRVDLLLIQAWLLQINDRNMAIPALIKRAEAILAAKQVNDAEAWRLWGEIYALRGSWIFPETPPAQRIEFLHAAIFRLPAAQCAWLRGFIYIQLVYLLVGQGEGEIARSQITQEIDAHGFGAGSYLTRLHHALAVAAYLDGSLAELHQACERFLSLAVRNDMTASMGWARFGLGWVAWQRCHAATAWELLLPIFEQPHAAHLQVTYLALSIMVPAAAEISKADQVDKLLNQMQTMALARESMLAGTELAALCAHAALLRGDQREANAWADEFAQIYQRLSPMQRRGPGLSAQILVYGKVVLASGNLDRVHAAFDPLQSYIQGAQARGGQVHVIQGVILLACCYWRTGQSHRALTWMQQAIDLGCQRGFRRAFFEQGADVAAMLYRLIESKTLVEQASQILTDYQAWSSGRVQPAQTEGIDTIEALTEREVDILDLMAQQLSNKEIAHRLDISPFTVRNHTSNIYSKLNVATRRQAVEQAQLLGLLPQTRA